MTKLTRRGLLGVSGSLLGLAACNPDALSDPEQRITVSADDRPGYPGSVSFDHGVASGDPLTSQVILWTRVTPDPAFPDTAIPVSYGLFADEAMTQPVRYGQGYALASRDYTAKVDVGDLEPGTVYYFLFIAKTAAGDVSSPVGRTRTTAPSGGAPVRFAIVSCSNYPFGQFHVYREIAKAQDLDAIIHLGDYIYEYGIEGLSAEAGKANGRHHEPPHETITLGDYRLRYAQYRRDLDLQAAHAAAPWLCTWDDHESANNAHQTGAQNHNPQAGEGNWNDRKQAAIQAYLEWMPVRDPVVGRARESIYRRFDFGDIATVICLESRLTGRSDEIRWATRLNGLEPEQVPEAAEAAMRDVADPARTMLGRVQEDWLGQQFIDSTAKGKTWQVLANQVPMARMRLPDFTELLSAEQIAAHSSSYVRLMLQFSQFGLPWSLDAWDGFPAARERLYASAKAAGARLVTLTGDSHTAWANTLVDSTGTRCGVEFACTSVTSPGIGAFVTGVEDLGGEFAAANQEVDWCDPIGHGWTVVTLTRDEVVADYKKVSTVTADSYDTEIAASFTTRPEGRGLSALSRRNTLP